MAKTAAIYLRVSTDVADNTNRILNRRPRRLAGTVDNQRLAQAFVETLPSILGWAQGATTS